MYAYKDNIKCLKLKVNRFKNKLITDKDCNLNCFPEVQLEIESDEAFEEVPIDEDFILEGICDVL